jgi:hypothetical protein
LDDAESFLADYGISSADAREIATAVCKKSNSFMEVFPMAREKSTWDRIKDGLKKSISGKKTEDDEDPDLLNTDGGSGDDDDGDDDEYEDAAPVVKALSDKVGELQKTIEVMAKAQTVILERLDKSAVLQKSIGEGIIAVMDRTDEVLASPAPRKGAVTQREAAMAKAMGGAAGSSDGGTVGGNMKPFTGKTIDMTKDILTKAVSDGEIDVLTCGRWETQMNKSVGKVAFPFTPDFVAFMQKKLSA